MLAYIAKRLLLMIPTLLGALTVTFVVMQFVPGGPIEQIMAEAGEELNENSLGVLVDAYDRLFGGGYITTNGATQGRLILLHP